MQREIKFRGKVVLGWAEGNWKEGDLLQHIMHKDQLVYRASIKTNSGVYAVDDKTVGQFIGLKDKNGKEVYEGDILDTSDGYAVVEHSSYDGGWDVRFSDGCVIGISEIIKSLVVAGNIYENPELLK